ncbi:MAG: DNA-3-methyladenine glycosylase [Nitrospirota bacterium]|nr:DNA-3-methyladenine glycosylase [Nitrospirota bacterium]MDH5586251.1 DNA-3-methyladenine glycosylase [Nitrospirota bacterium]MDH5774123.1 DNA-3-methyladenine glycosylase [Nitrospirota bacterium]
MPTKKGNPKLLPLKRRLRSNQTRAEQLLWAKLRSNQIHELKFRRQHGIESYIVDFFCPERNVAIEVDGDVHAGNRQQTKDAERERYLRSLGIRIVRYTNDEVFNNLDGVLEDLSLRLASDSTSPSPSLQRRGKLNKDIRDKIRKAPPPETAAFLTKEGKIRNHYNPLPREFYARPTLKVAKDLLGKVLMTQTSDNLIQSKIVDVEAYVGPKDKACHASKGRTKRTEIMFGPAGFTYVYLIYGMYHCLNIVTEREDYPAAILIRGLEVLENNDPPTFPTRIDGPGRVCRYLEVDRTHNGLDTTYGKTLWIEEQGLPVSRKQIQALPRIGVDYAGNWAKKLWRFCLPAPASPKGGKTKPTE